MVMEAATLTSPHRKFSVVPVQKSLSLPSYARAGGGGIDHRLIFAALEQKEKGRRRKSSIFTREKKSARQNIFCLPIPSSRHEKCRETSFSSDTSCSSLEYQKPKKTETKTKTTPHLTEPARTTTNPSEFARKTTTQSESTISILQHSESKLNEVQTSRINNSETTSSLGEVHRINADYIARLNVCSSDSMERSSRSSTDSFSRKERLVAMKARVEAAREKYGYSSSEDESRSTMTRYNSDGSIHRSVREVKSRSSRSERRLRRRSQGEWSNQLTYGKINRKKNLNLSLNAENGVQLNLDSPKADNDIDNLDIKTDFCPSPNFPDSMKKNYFSDFPSRENSARFVQARIRYIEDEERKRRSGSDFREIKTPRHSPQSFENISPASTERKYPFGKQNGSTSSFLEKYSIVDVVSRCSPLPRSSQAPTPPPRSPKSMTFMNKAFIQHQNASLRKKESCVDQSKYSQSNIPSHTEIFDQFNAKKETSSNEGKYFVDSVNSSSEKQKIRELIGNRRKTCGNFDFIDKTILDDLCSIKGSVDSSSSIVAANKKFTSVMQIRGTESKGYFSSSETPCAPSEEDLRSKLWKTKWQETDQRREYMFNSLESKKSNPPSWIKMRNSKEDTCLCRLFPEEKFMCVCKSERKEISTSTDMPFIKKEICNPMSVKIVSPIKNMTDRLCKSEVNIASKEQNRSPVVNTNVSSNSNENTPTVIDNLKSNYSDKISASANLESAMEELENVYRSLKISSDNLSDRNSVSNASLSDDGSKTSKPINSNNHPKDNSDFKRRSSVCESNWKSELNTSFGICNIGKSAFRKYNDTSSACYPKSVSINKTSDTNQLSIDELFNNMTLQLDDLEKNLMKDDTGKAFQQSECNHESNRLDNKISNNNSSSQISIRKQFFDNLCKSSQNQSKSDASVLPNNDIQNKSPCLDKKKHKAIRSLSHNLSNLMASTDSIKDNTGVSCGGMNSSTPHSPRLAQTSPIFNERTHFDAISNVSKADVVLKRPSLFANTNKDTAQNPKRDEIRHIRVSMGSDFNQTKPMTSDSRQECRKYPRLSSAVSSSQMPSSKCEVSKGIHVPDVIPHSNSLQKQYHPLNSDMSSSQVTSSTREVSMGIPVQDVISHSNSIQDSKHYPRSNSTVSSSLVSSSKSDASLGNSVTAPPISNHPKDSVDVDGLEKLLNSLLGDVPERQQSSLLLNTTTPPPVSSGEMRVLQHLDVIRLKPVPS